MRFTVIQANMIRDDYEWHLHAAGCRDLAANKYVLSEQFIEEAANADAAVDGWIDDELLEMGWLPEHVKVFPCATDPHWVTSNLEKLQDR